MGRLPLVSKKGRKPDREAEIGSLLNPQGEKWWRDKGPNVGNNVFRMTRTLRDAQSMRMSNLLRWFRLYNNAQARTFLPGSYTRTDFGLARANRLTLNLIGSGVDTVCAKIAKNRPKPTFLTTGATWSEQKKAKLLDKFCQGLFYQTDFYKTAAEVFRDATIFGTGAVKILRGDDDRVRIERAFIDEIFVDELEAIYGPPQTLYQIRVMPRETALAMFSDAGADAKNVIRDAPIAKVDGGQEQWARDADLVTLVESWHLPSSTPKKLDPKQYLKLKAESIDDTGARKELDAFLFEGCDGRRAITIEGNNGKNSGTLLYESWRETSFPFEFMHWIKPVRGFQGIGIPEQGVAIQYELNKILRKIQESIDFCVPKMLVEDQSKVVASHLDDIAGGIIKYARGSTPPALTAWSSVSPELFTQVDRLSRQFFEVIGISQLSAQAKKPAGLESGRALREMNDIESERFLMVGRAYEDFVLGTAKKAIAKAREIAFDNGNSYPVTAPIRRKMAEPIDWKEIDLEDDAFVMQVFPTSALPNTPEGRLQMVQDLMTMGFLEKEDVIRLLDFPDLEAVNELAEASADFTMKQIEEMIDGKARQPEPFMNLKYALGKAQASYLRAEMLDVGESSLKFLRDYMLGCQKMLEAIAPPAMPGELPGAPGVPAGPPGPAPFGTPGSLPPQAAAPPPG
jgi:hypothetical protein